MKEHGSRKQRRPPPGGIVRVLMTLIGLAIAEKAPRMAANPETLDDYQSPSMEGIGDCERMELLDRTKTPNSAVKVNGNRRGEYVAENQVGRKKKIGKQNRFPTREGTELTQEDRKKRQVPTVTRKWAFGSLQVHQLLLAVGIVCALLTLVM